MQLPGMGLNLKGCVLCCEGPTGVSFTTLRMVLACGCWWV